MAYERYPRGTQWRGDDNYDRDRDDYGSGRTGGYDRDQMRGMYGRDDRYNTGGDRYGQRGGAGDYDRDQFGARGNYGSYGASQGRGYGGTGGSYGSYDRGQTRSGGTNEYHGSYASDGRRFEDVGDRRDWDDDNRNERDRGQYGRGRDDARGYGRQPQGYDYQDRGFVQRAGDEVRSWFGDDDAERRREMDSRYDERYERQRQANDRDSDYHSWRAGQIAALDRDYDEYRSENRTKFENEFASWRTTRQGQRSSLSQVQEHDEVVGSDGSHVGTVDKVRGDRILLTKNDADAGGQHHSIPSNWIQSVADKKVTLSKTADEAKKQWRDEESNQAMFGYRDNTRRQRSDDESGRTDLNRSFSKTY